MKRLLALCLCLCRALPSCAFAEVANDGALLEEFTAVGDEGADEQEMLDEEASEAAATPVSIASVNGLLYILNDTGRLDAYRPDTRETTEIGRALSASGYMTVEQLNAALELKQQTVAVDRLIDDGATVYGVCFATGECWRLLNDAGAFAPEKLGVTLDTGFMSITNEDYGAIREVPHDAFIRDGFLYFVIDLPDATAAPSSAGRISLKDGKTTLFKTENIHNLMPYKDGKLIACIYDSDTLYSGLDDMGKSAFSYGLFDPQLDVYAELGELTTSSSLGAMGICGMCVDTSTNTLFFASGSRVMGQDLGTGKQRISAYLSYEASGTKCAYIQGHYYAIATYTGLDVRMLDTEAAKLGALRIFGEYGSDAHRAFIVNYPDIPVEVADSYSDSLESLANAMVSGSDAYDVLKLDVVYMPVDRLARKGYCMDLSQFPEIVKRVERMDQRYVNVMVYNDALFGVPVGAATSVCAVNPQAWAQLGLTDDDLPTNLVDFYDFIANYAWDYGDAHGDLLLFDSMGESLKQTLFQHLLREYAIYYQSINQRLTFDTDLFRELIHAFEQINFKELDAPASEDYYSKPSIFTLDTSITYCLKADSTLRPLPLSLTKRVDPALGASLSVLTINPRSSHKKDAVTYICNYLDNLEIYSKMMLCPDMNESVEQPDYQKGKAEYERQIRRKKDQLAKAEESQKPAMRNEIDLMQQMLTELERYRWLITDKQIASYRALYAPYTVPMRQSVLLNASDNISAELQKLYSRYLGGQIDAERFIHDLNQRVRMMILEDM